MTVEAAIRVKQGAFLLKSNFSAESYIELLRLVFETGGLLQHLPPPGELLPGIVSISPEAFSGVCKLLRDIRITKHCEREPSANQGTPKNGDTPLSRREEERVAEIVYAFNQQLSTNEQCKSDGRFWPFVDAFALDEAIRSVYEGVNPFGQFANVLRTYFLVGDAPIGRNCSELILEYIDALLRSWNPAADGIDGHDKQLLLKTTSLMRGCDGIDDEAMISFVGASSEVANIYLEHCPAFEKTSELLRLLILVFQIGNPGHSVVPRNSKKGQAETVLSRISRLLALAHLGLDAPFLSDAFKAAVAKISYKPKTIEVRHIDRLAPLPLDGDDTGEALYRAVAENLKEIVQKLSVRWPGTVDSLFSLTCTLEQHYDQVLYDEGDPTVGLEAGMMSAGLSKAGPETLSSEDRSEHGLRIAAQLIDDGWPRASDEYVGFLLLMYSFFPSELSPEERKLFSKHFSSHPTALRSGVVVTALAQLAADSGSDVNRLWAGQYIAQPATAQIRLIRSREDYASPADPERTLALDVGGPDCWSRLQRRTRQLLVEAEMRWSDECHKIGRTTEWGATAGAFFMPIEYELKHWFSLLSDEPIRTACVSRGIKIEKGYLTAGPIIVVLRKLYELPDDVRGAVRARGLDVEKLVPLMKQMGDSLHLRNQAFHADDFGVDKLIRMRQALFSGGLLRSFSECLPPSAQ